MRLKQFVTNSEIIDNDVSYCGVHDYRYNEGNENGEAIYIGTSSNQVYRVCVHRRMLFVQIV